MAEEKSPKPDAGAAAPGGTPPAVEPAPSDRRLIPGGSFKSARTAIGMNAMDHYTEAPVIKAALPDLSNTPGWNMVPKPPSGSGL